MSGVRFEKEVKRVDICGDERAKKVGSKIGEVAFRAKPTDIGVGKRVISTHAHGETFLVVLGDASVPLNGHLV